MTRLQWQTSIHNIGPAPTSVDGPSIKSVLVPLSSLTGIHSVIAASSAVVPVLAPVIAIDLGVAPSAVGFYSAVFFAGAMIAGLVSGGFIGRYGAFRITQRCLALCAFGLAVTTVSGSLLPLGLSAILVGFGAGPPTPASSEILSRVSPKRLKSLVFSVKQCAVPLGGAVAGATMPLLAVALGWRWAAATGALTCAFVFLAIQPLSGKYDVYRQPEGGLLRASVTGSLLQVLKDANLRILAGSSFAFACTHASLNSFFVTYLVNGLDMPLVLAGSAFSAAQIGGTAGRIVWGWIADSIIKPRTLLGCLAVTMSATAIVVAQYSGNWPISVILVVSCFFGATSMGWNGVFLSEVARIAPPGETACTTGGAVFVNFAGLVVGPLAFSGVLAVTGSYAAGFMVIAMAPAYMAIELLCRR